MTLPFDASPPEVRPESMTFYTDTVTANAIRELMEKTGLDRSLLLHRIVKAAVGEVAPAQATIAPSTDDGK